jgi:hypothetical protein
MMYEVFFGMEGGSMKKFHFLVIIVLLSLFCSPKSEQADISMEDGVEAVRNYLEPYNLKGELTGLSLEKELSIDFGSEKIGELGIADALDFEVDSEGNVYFFYAGSNGDSIFKFDSHGRYLISFGTIGQGPGEIQYIVWTGIDSQDNIIVSDNGNRKILIFDHDGGPVKEIPFPSKVGLLYPLENGNLFGLWTKHPPPSNKYMYVWAFSLYDPQFEEIKLLDTQNVYDFNTQGTRGIVARPFNTRRFSQDHIYLACEDRGYEILKYDLEGNLVQKIRKEHRPVLVSEETMKERNKRYEPFGEKLWFPKYWLPMGSFFLDDEGRIFVKTFEKAENSDGYIFDIFNPDGVFINRKAMDILTLGDAYVCARARKEKLYCFQEKPDGFREFNRYRMKWE